MSDCIRVEPKEALRLVVDERDAAERISRDRALANAVQNRLALLQQRRDLVWLEPERLPLDPPREQHRPGAAEEQSEKRRDEQHWKVSREPRADALLEDADRDEADDPAVRIADRHLCAHRASERSGLGADERPACEHSLRILAGVVQKRFPEHLRIRM